MRLALLTPITLLPLACADTAGPCVVSFEDPLVRITSSLDSVSGDPIPRLQIERIVFDGVTADLAPFASPAEGVVLSNDGLLECEVPCSLGARHMEGFYRITTSAPGYQPQIVEVDAQYAKSEGPGCPVVLSEGVELDVRLDPQ